MNQQQLRALVILLASMTLLAALGKRSVVELPNVPAIAQHSLASDDQVRLAGSLRLEKFGEEAIVIPPVPPPERSHLRSSEYESIYFDGQSPRSPVIQDVGSLVDCGVAVLGNDGIVIPPVPPPVDSPYWRRYFSINR
ncbi:MAG TPA: hypothetical protein VFI31_14120 [Pirellulales bacterium]|nr:hypothetical protein [Pirellulales bacterium]